jgi:hypothetical protein
MENCRRRQSSSVSVLLPTGGHNPSVSEGDGNSAAGIDSWQRVVKPRYSYRLHASKHLVRSPVAQAFLPVFLGDWAMAIFFQLFYGSRGRSMSVQLDENWLCL